MNNNFDLLRLVEMFPRKYPFLLESSSRGNNHNRNSIVFFKPEITLIKECKDSNFLNKFNQLWEKNNVYQEKMVVNNKEIGME